MGVSAEMGSKNIANECFLGLRLVRRVNNMV